MEEPAVVSRPALSASLEQVECPLDVGANELPRAQDASVDVALGGEVHDEVRFDLVEHGIDRIHVGDVHSAERIVRERVDRLQTAEICSIGELVDVDELVLLVLGYQSVQEVGTNEAGATGDHDLHRLLSASRLSITGTFGRRHAGQATNRLAAQVNR